MDNFEDVATFSKKFEVPQLEKSGLLDSDTLNFRIDFMYEELFEFEAACKVGDVADAFDALIDLVYVALGTAWMMRLPWQQGWDEVQRANMQKVKVATAAESKRGSNIDVRKPEGWQPPDLRKYL